MTDKFWFKGGLLLILCMALACCPKKEEPKDTAVAAQAVAPKKAPSAQTKVNLKKPSPVPLRSADGRRIAVVDMRVRAKRVQQDVKPSDAGWQPKGDWQVFEIPYRDGDLRLELAFQVPRKIDATKAVPGSIRPISGDAKPFLRALAYIFGSKPAAAQKDDKQGDKHALDVFVKTTTGKDTGLADLEPTGGDWLVVRCQAKGTGRDVFEMKINPTQSLGRISPPETKLREQALLFMVRALMP